MVLLGNFEIVEDPLSTDTLTLEGGVITVRDFLGYGRYGAVVAGRDVRTNNFVALKVMKKADIQQTHLDVQREIDIQRALDHPNIVKLLDVFADQINVYLVLELAQGGDLWGRVAQGALDEPTARVFFIQLIDVVGYMHRRGIAHRDIKLENLLLDARDQVKICDFGLSAVMQPPPNHLMLLTSGSKHYVGPEVWRALHGAGYRGEPSDIWSCGVVLFAMICGCYPFEIESSLADTSAYQYLVQHGEYPFPKEASLSPTVKQLFNRIFNPNPVTRVGVAEIQEEPWYRGEYTFPPLDPIKIPKEALEHPSSDLIACGVPSSDDGEYLSDELIGGDISSGAYRGLSENMLKSNDNTENKPVKFIRMPDIVPNSEIIDTDAPMFRALKAHLPRDMTIMECVEKLPLFRSPVMRCTAFILKDGDAAGEKVCDALNGLSAEYGVADVTLEGGRVSARCGLAESDALFDAESAGQVLIEAALYRFGETGRVIVEVRRKRGDIVHYGKVYRALRKGMECEVLSDYPPVE